MEKVAWPHVDINLTDEAYVHVSPENQKRGARERQAVLKLFGVPMDEPRFSLPLGAPAAPKAMYDFEVATCYF